MLLVVVGSGACKVRADIGVEVKDDGSGLVTVRVGLDQEAVEELPNFADAVRVDDLTAKGWTVTGPAQETDTFTYVTATKPFANPDEANTIFAEVSGETGPFRDFTLARSRSFAKTEFTFSGTVDFAGGLESFSDSDLAAQLDGKPLGDDVAAIEQQIGQKLDDAFEIRVSVRLPGDVNSNAPSRAVNGAVWQPRLSQPAAITLEASSTSTRWTTIVGAGAAVLAALTLVVLLVVRAMRRRRPQRSPSVS